MHCLYCDRPLALLKRLTGDGEFCSKEHRRIYQKEHNQLALARLLAAQSEPKPQPPNGLQEGKPAAAKSAAPEERRPAELDQRQPAAPQKPQPAPEQRQPAARQEPQPVKTEKRQAAQREERQPPPADFVADKLPDARAISGTVRFSGAPRYQSADPVRSRKSDDRASSGPKTADGLRSELSQPRISIGAIRFPDKPAFVPLAAVRREEKLPSLDARVTVRHQLAAAGFLPERPAAPVYSSTISSAATRQPEGPRFGPIVPATVWSRSALPQLGGDPKLRLAALVVTSTTARSVPDRIRRLAAEAQWKPLPAALPTQPPAKIFLVLGSFLQRPVRTVSQESLPQGFEIPFRPISFPRYGPRMGRLEERLHRTDRIGFSPP